MILKMWVDVYPWQAKLGVKPIVSSTPPSCGISNGGRRYRIEFEVPDFPGKTSEIPVDGVIKPIFEEIVSDEKNPNS